jgi:hypothetical protein
MYPWQNSNVPQVPEIRRSRHGYRCSRDLAITYGRCFRLHTAKRCADKRDIEWSTRRKSPRRRYQPESLRFFSRLAQRTRTWTSVNRNQDKDEQESHIRKRCTRSSGHPDPSSTPVSLTFHNLRIDIPPSVSFSARSRMGFDPAPMRKDCRCIGRDGSEGDQY